MSKLVTVLFPNGDPFADDVLKHFLSPGSNKRPRSFEPVEDSRWHGSVNYGQNAELSIEVEVIRCPSNERPDWCISAAARDIVGRTQRGKGHFTFSKWKLGNMSEAYPSRQHLVGFRMVPNMTTKNAANELAAAITRQSIDPGGWLAFPGGEQGEHRRYFEQWIRSQQPIELISACCLHASEDRHSIAASLDQELTSLLIRVAQASFSNLPQVTNWRITTFGPDDYDWLGELGIMKVLLPYMWNAPKTKVVADLTHNLALTEGLVEELNAALPFPVCCEQMCHGATEIDMEFLVNSSQERARQMLPRLLENPPAIFSQLRTTDEKFARIQQEAFLYLYDTIRFGQRPEQPSAATLYVGLEIHGGYWQHGQLFIGPNQEFLPLVWLPQAVRQHWASWAKANRTLHKERLRIGQGLSYFGF